MTLNSSSPAQVQIPAAFWVLWPGAVMSLGWGLRGYIGGGPFGAMIPGVLVALALCLLLGYRREAVALAAAMGAVGIGFGGNMTYGQTIGFVREPETFWWGLTGLTLKGAIWGLLGGAVLGTALVAPRLRAKHLALASLVFLIACSIGIALINEPKLIYFSNRLDRPRDESWAGLLFGALAWLTYFGLRHTTLYPAIARFAFYGFIAGGIGFGGGSLWIALGEQLGAPHWPWWKFMEFTFGFCFGAGLGLCALHLRERLLQTEVNEEPEPPMFILPTLLLSAALAIAVYFVWRLLAMDIRTIFQDLPRQGLLRTALGTCFGFMGLGCILMLLARNSYLLAWQVGASITFIHCVIDLREDWGPEGKLDIAPWYGWTMAGIASVLVICLVLRWQRKFLPVSSLLILLLWAHMLVGYAKGFSTHHFWAPPTEAVSAAGGMGAYLFQNLWSEAIVHMIFTTLLILSLLGTLRLRTQMREM